MSEVLVGFRQWSVNQTEVCRVFEETGIIGTLKRVFKPPRTVDVPSKVEGVPLSLYGITLFGSERVEVTQDGEVIFRG